MIAIYGAGNAGKIFYKIISKYEKVDLFIDKYKHGIDFEGIPVVSLEDIKKYNIEKIYNSVTNYESEVLKDLNNQNVYTFVETLKKYPEIINAFCLWVDSNIQERYSWLGSKLYLPKDSTKINKVRNLLKDEKSINFFDRWLNFRKTLDMKYYPYPTNSLEEEYFMKGLDETVYNFKPDYIKMDIEGAEIEALKGAKNIIKDFTPNLAIAIYHKAEDLWEIPLYINSINPNYDFYIRCHNHLCVETILYCKRKR